MRKTGLGMLFLAVLSGLIPVSQLCGAEVIPGQPAPAFSATDTKGKTHNLADYKGKIVVLEWLNHECPFVKKHYNSGNMQKLQKSSAEKGIVWLSIISSAPGKQGNCTPEQADSLTAENKAVPAAVLLDPEGELGRLYGAKTTPHMFIIDAAGILVYNGAIDDIRSTNVEDIAKAKNYVQAALDEMLAGKPVTIKTSQPYGCTVKYK
jgi:peroxiredoxin